MNNKQSLYSIYFITLILSTCSILYELLIAQAVVSLTANMVVFYSLTIGFYLISMGAGAFYFYKSYKSQNLWAYLFRVEILLAVLGAFAVFVIYAGHMMLGFLKNHFHLFSGSFIFWGLALMMIVFIGFLTGIEMPLLLKIGKDSTSLRITNRLLAFDYFGSLAGGMMFPLILLPYFELIEIGIIVSFVNLLVAFFILFSLKDHRIGWAQKIIQIFLIAFFVVVFLNAKNLQQFFLKKYYYGETSNSFISLFSSVKELPNVEHYKTLYQDIDIVQVPPMESPYRELLRIYSKKYQLDPDFPENVVLFIDRLFQFWSDFEELYHEYFAHIPVVLNNSIPERVLVLGAGDGLLIRELLKYPGIKSITQVDIDSKIIQLAQAHPLMKKLNNNALMDSRLKIIISDAYTFLRSHKEKYDAIYMDFPAPFDYNLSKLYSREFYRFALQSLKDDGYVVLDAPNMHKAKGGMEHEIKAYFYTLKSAGFKTVFFFSSKLEETNQEAQAMMLKAIGDRDKLTIVEQSEDFGIKEEHVNGREAIMRRFLSDFINDYQETFIFLKKEGGDFNKEYKNFIEDLFVLNKERFYLAISQPQMDAQKTESSYVNSIFRPTLPSISHWWQAKFPY